MDTVVQLTAIVLTAWVARTAILRWSVVRLREAEIANRRVDLEFDQFEVIKEHQKASRGIRLSGMSAPIPGIRRSPEELS
jgi:hypothetical protein